MEITLKYSDKKIKTEFGLDSIPVVTVGSLCIFLLFEQFASTITSLNSINTNKNDNALSPGDWRLPITTNAQKVS